MPKLISITTPALLVLLLASGGNAQLAVGVRGGFSYSELVGGQIQSDPKTGLMAGAFVGLRIASNWWIQPETWYVQKGAKFEGVVSGTEPASVTIDIDYVEFLLPVGIDFTVESESVQPRLYAGPALGIALRCSQKFETQDATNDCKDNYKSSDFGVLLGFGVELGSGSSAFLADLRYDYGLADINSKTQDEVTRKNRSLQLLVGYRRQF